jgi:hypothetical protein
VTQESEGRLFAASLEVKKGDTPTLLELTPVDGEDAVARGDAKVAPYFPIGLTLVPVIGTSGTDVITTNFALDLIWGRYANVYGAHISSLVAQVEGEVHGAQISGAAALAGRIRGAQLAGVFNYADDVEGAQISLVNIAGTLRGLQLGLVNVTEDNQGFRLGLLNISPETQYRVGGWTGETDPFELGLKVSNGPLYTLFTAGTGSFTDTGPWTFGFGMGGHIAFEPFFLDIDAAVLTVHRTREFEHAQVIPTRLRAMFGWRPLERFAIFAGVTGTVAVDIGDGSGLEAYAPKWAEKVTDRVRIWPGFVAGIEI